MMNQPRFLVIQTAFIGDAILATALLEKLHKHYPESDIDYMVRKGNESLFKQHPFIKNLLVWDKKKGKYKELLRLLKMVRKTKYDYVINLQRFASTGVFTVLSRGKQKIGFSKNPFSFLYNQKYEHRLDSAKHEVERNQLLISKITDNQHVRPKLYPLDEDFEKVKSYKKGNYICISPASVWFTKQFPKEKWIEFIKLINSGLVIYLLGGSGDMELCDEIITECQNNQIYNLTGKLNLLQSAALMKDAVMNYSNDSAPLHLASSMNAPVTAVFCSTVAGFGFGPLSDKSLIIETHEALSCRPCGLHGKKECPEMHFKCAKSIDTNELVAAIKN